MELDSKVYVMGTFVGALLMLGSLIAYIMVPMNPMILLFIIGFVLLLVGYIQVYRENRSLYKEYESIQGDEDLNGFFIVLDEDYIPYDDPATIEDLRG